MPTNFTLPEARALLVEIAPRMRRAVQLHVLFLQQVQDLGKAGVRVSTALLEGTKEARGAQPLADRARAVHDALQEEIQGMESLGVQLKGLGHGLVDFPSFLDGDAPVLLCWKLGEPTVAFFHHLDAGFAGRQPVGSHVFTRTRRSTQPTQ